ncbi:MAG: hypothetical protein IK057_04445 [Clostridia bacterium]|nr:hypothetical protein [Clostridia bacterium]
MEKITFWRLPEIGISQALSFAICRFSFGNLKKCLTNISKTYIIGSVSVFADGVSANGQ